jgi:hypothetical protein
MRRHGRNGEIYALSDRAGDLSTTGSASIFPPSRTDPANRGICISRLTLEIVVLGVFFGFALVFIVI